MLAVMAAVAAGYGCSVLVRYQVDKFVIFSFFLWNDNKCLFFCKLGFVSYHYIRDNYDTSGSG